MNARVFNEIRRIVYEASGIRIQEGKESMVAARLGYRLRNLQLPDETAYLEYLSQQLDREIVELIDVISTNVTSFYREAEHFSILEEALVEWRERGQRRFRLWCAASSSGEEPYTIAITARDSFRRCSAPVDWRLLATDISTRVLGEATAGYYPKSRLENVPAEIVSRHFEPERNGVLRVRSDLRSRVVFRRLNLSKSPFPMRGPLDVVFCRNVMIYFDEATRARLVAEFCRLLKPGGLLIIGKAESLTDSEHRFERAGPSTYRRGE